jgi:hypothetical protein
MTVENPIGAWLDAAGIPWRSTRGELIARYGVAKRSDGPYGVVEIGLKPPPLKSLVRPLYAPQSKYFSPHVPATEFVAETYFTTDERENLRRTADELRVHLGPVQIADHWNTVRVVWTFDRSRVRLLAWPADMQRVPLPRQPDDECDPRLRLGCYITINTGFLPEMSRQELAWIRSFVPIGPISSFTLLRNLDTAGPPENELEFVRDPDRSNAIAGMIGVSADGEALLFQLSHLYILPLERVTQIRVERTLPAKGPGGSELKLECQTDYEGLATKMVTVCRGFGADDLNDLGRTLAKAAKKPVELSRYFSDC